jgi:hypothetical protein
MVRAAGNAPVVDFRNVSRRLFYGQVCGSAPKLNQKSDLRFREIRMVAGMGIEPI